MKTKRITGEFMRHLKDLLKTLAPMAFLLGIGLSAAASGGSWEYFFSDSLFDFMPPVMGAWIALCIYGTIMRKSTRVHYDDYEEEESCTNPATGMPMQGGMGGFDTGGNSYGSSGH